jgi:hypothetical protein
MRLELKLHTDMFLPRDSPLRISRRTTTLEPINSNVITSGNNVDENEISSEINGDKNNVTVKTNNVTISAELDQIANTLNSIQSNDVPLSDTLHSIKNNIASEENRKDQNQTEDEMSIQKQKQTNRRRLEHVIESKRRLAIAANIARKIAMQRDKHDAQAIICSLVIGLLFSIAVFIIVIIHTMITTGQLTMYHPIKSPHPVGRRKGRNKDLSTSSEQTKWSFPTSSHDSIPVITNNDFTMSTSSVDVITIPPNIRPTEIVGQSSDQPQILSIKNKTRRQARQALIQSDFFPAEMSSYYAQGQLLYQSSGTLQETFNGQNRFAAPHLPRTALTLENAGWGFFHAPLPPSWALVQASASLISGHTPGDRAMLGDLLGNSYSLEEISIDELSQSPQPSFAYLVKAAQEHTPTSNSPLDVAKDLYSPREEEYLPSRLPGDDEEDQEEIEHESLNYDSSLYLPSLSHPPARRRMFSSKSGLEDSIHQDIHQLGLVKQLATSTWVAYKQHAWGKDALKPISLVGEDSFGGLCMMIVDSLDTLLILGMRDDFDEAIEYVLQHLNLTEQEDINLFESTIRIIGGLLSAYELDDRRDARILQKAVHVADALSIGFDSPSGIPYGTIGLRTKKKYNPTWVSGSTVAEVATLTLEWEHLSYLTGDPKYAIWVRRAMSGLLFSEVTTDSLFPTFLNPETGDYSVQHVTLGARGDSAYEYLLKPYLLAGGMRDTRKWAVVKPSLQGEESGFSFPGLVGNTALLSASSSRSGYTRNAVTTASYAPPGNSVAGIVWRACSATLQQDSLSTTSSLASSFSYADSIATYEIRARRLLNNALGKKTQGAHEESNRRSLSESCNDDYNIIGEENSTTNNCGERLTPKIVENLPTFHPTAFMHPQNAQITQASEASWFTAFFGYHLRSLAGIEHQLVRITQPVLQSPTSLGSQACTLSITQGKSLPKGLSCIGSIATGEGGRFSYVVERNGESRLSSTSPQDSVTAAVAQTANAVKDAKNAAAVALESYTSASFLLKTLESSLNEHPHGTTDLYSKLESTAQVVEQALEHLQRTNAALDQAAAAADAALKYSSTAPPGPPPAFTYDSKVDHLVCFLPGHLALSSSVAPTRGLRRRHLALAKRLMRTCMRMYSVTHSGIAAEIYRAGSPADAESGLLPDASAKHSLLRPETVESLFILYRITGEQIYRDWGAQILSSIMKNAQVPNKKHVASVSDVTSGGGTIPTPLSDSLESFFFAETIKYLFLLFSGPDIIPLDEFVFNTEAHPFKVWGSM